MFSTKYKKPAVNHSCGSALNLQQHCTSPFMLMGYCLCIYVTVSCIWISQNRRSLSGTLNGSSWISCSSSMRWRDLRKQPQRTVRQVLSFFVVVPAKGANMFFTLLEVNCIAIAFLPSAGWHLKSHQVHEVGDGEANQFVSQWGQGGGMIYVWDDLTPLRKQTNNWRNIRRTKDWTNKCCDLMKIG